MNKELGLFASVALVIAVATFASSFGTATVNSASGISYHSNVCVYKDGVLVAPCHHNLFTQMGQNITRDLLGTYTSLAKVNYIGVANSTSSQAATDTSLQGEWASCGLSRAAGTYSTVQTSPGNWTIANTFTSTCNSVTVNGTGLYNATSGSTLFAETTFTTVTLQTNDQLTVTWQIWVS